MTIDEKRILYMETKTPLIRLRSTCDESYARFAKYKKS
jgi:hypothetical protein